MAARVISIPAFDFHSSHAHEHGHMGNEGSQTCHDVKFVSSVHPWRDSSILGRSGVVTFHHPRNRIYSASHRLLI